LTPEPQRCVISSLSGFIFSALPPNTHSSSFSSRLLLSWTHWRYPFFCFLTNQLSFPESGEIFVRLSPFFFGFPVLFSFLTLPPLFKVFFPPPGDCFAQQRVAHGVNFSFAFLFRGPVFNLFLSLCCSPPEESQVFPFV